jgi:hypothetical protein
VARWTWALLPWVLAYAGSATAQPSASDVALATELFNAGRDLMKAGDLKNACPKLAESVRLDPKVGAIARLAECEEASGQLALARGHWQQAGNLARATGDSRLAHAEAEFARIDKVVPKLEVVLSGDPPSGLALVVDDARLGPASLGIKLPIDPGQHTILVSATGKKTWSTHVDATADGAVHRVVVSLLEEQAPPEKPTPPPPIATRPEMPERVSTFPWRTVGIGSTAVGVAGLGVGIVFGLIAKSRFDDSNAQPGGCNGNDCPPNAADTRNSARSAGNLSTAFAVTGGALTVTGIAMWLLAPAPELERVGRVLPRLDRSGAMLSYARAW